MSDPGWLPRRCLATLLAAVVLSGCSDAREGDAEPWLPFLARGEQAFRQQDLAQAEAAFRQALALAEAAGSASGRAASLEGLATSRAVQGDMDAADSLFARLLDLQERRFTADSLSAAALVRVLGSLGEVSLRRAQPERALRFFNRILALADTGAIDLHQEDPAMVHVLRGLAAVRAAQGDSAGADSLRSRAAGLELYIQGFGAYIGDDFNAAEQALRRALELQTTRPGPTPGDVAHTAHALALVLEARGQSDAALPFYEEAARAFQAAADDPIAHAATLRDWAAALPPTEAGRRDSLLARAGAVHPHPPGRVP